MNYFFFSPPMAPSFRFIFVFAALMLFSCLPGRSLAAPAVTQAESVHIEADSISYEQDKDRYTALGKVKLTFSDFTLTADEMKLDVPLNKAVASGSVRFKTPADSLEGERLELDWARGTGVLYEGRAFLSANNFYLRARQIEKTGENTYRALDARATTCDSETPDWQIAGGEIEVTIDGYGKLKDGKFLVRNLPVFYLPYLIFPAKTTRQSGFIFPRINHSQKIHGLDIEAPYFFALAENIDATLYLRYLEKSGVKVGLEHRYLLGDASFGGFYADYLDDGRTVVETRGAISRNWPQGAPRWSLYWQHETIFSPSSYLRLDLYRLSDIWYFRDFSAANYYLDNYAARSDDRFKRVSFIGDESLTTLTSTARLVWKYDFYYFNLLMKQTEDLIRQNNDATWQKYPEITFGGTRRTLFDGPLQYEWGGLLSYNHRELGHKGYLADLAPTIYLPLNLGGILSVLPQATLQGTYWSRDDSPASGNSRAEGRFIYNLALNLSTDFHRVFNIAGSRVEKIRHWVKPEVTYRYTPDVEQANLPDFVPKIPAVNSITYALTTNLVGRSRDSLGNAAYWDYLRLKLSQTYDIRESTRELIAAMGDRRPLKDILLELDLTPEPRFSFSARNSYDVYGGQWRQANYDLAVRAKRGDVLTLGYRFTRDLLEEAKLSLKAVLSKELDVSYAQRVDIRGGKDLEKTFAAIYRKQCWQMEFSYSVKERDTIFMLNLSLYGLGTIGVW